MQFSFQNPTKIEFGQDSIKSLKALLPLESKVLLVYGGGSIKRNGIYQQVMTALEDHNVMEFSGVEANPTYETLSKAVELVKAQGIDFVLAVGGGSVIDGCKYIVAASCYDGDGWDILTGAHYSDKALPLGVVLTLPATGSESNAAAVVTKAATQDKLSFYNDIVRPRFAILNPDVIKTLPERQQANGIIDAFIHVCEQYLTLEADTWVQDGYAEVLLRNLVKLAAQFEQRDNDIWRANLMWTANQALYGLVGNGVTHDWSTHMIGHEITAIYGVDHARTLTIVQPSLLRSQIEYKRGKLNQLGSQVFNLAQGDDLAERAIDALEQLYSKLGLPVRLSEAGIKDADAVDKLVAALEKHAMTAIGEHKAIDIATSRAILLQAS
ncbi:iron-containing alcohol dehydrogenase [Shewanella sp. SR44-3]|uniref:iron-containing alcohol dehydrogenase n=1 Tax=Shewanella sp. SR44-3 TaxID=2760936 RepID=UPI0015F91249|nr:iron-containing alcohol dehydrogenase [Shewanella sp. SR44-3]MBB1269624.1 iron-containing alcohol dehydrogenase [Shewanella sp. SR44-3]